MDILYLHNGDFSVEFYCEKVFFVAVKNRAIRVSVISIGVNLVLAGFKLFAGVFARSGAMVSDAVHSASDVFSTLIVMAGIKMSGKVDDDDHPYGHERLESVAAVILSVILTAVGIGIGYQGVVKIISAGQEPIAVPGALALIAAVVSIVVKEGMFWYTRKVAKAERSDALLADAWHHRSDALSSVGSLIGIGGAMLGFAVLDPLASVVISVFVVKAGIDIFRQAVNKMIDKSCPPAVVNAMKEVVLQFPGVQTLDDIRTRMFGARVYVDLEIGVDGQMVLKDAHDIAQKVHDAIEAEFRDVKHCMVHVNPK